MRSERAMMSSRREILADALGTAFVMGLPSPIGADESRSRQGQSNTSTSKASRTTEKISLTWDVFLGAQHTCHHERFAPRRKTKAVAAHFVNSYFWRAGRCPGRHPDYRRAGARPGELGCGPRKESDDDLRHPWPRRSFLWRQYSSGAICRRPFRRAAGSD